MRRFHQLGTVDLRDEAGEEIRIILAQPKRLALLAYLTSATSSGTHRRDTLLGMFWPELDEERGRNALSKGLTFLRQGLGAAAVVTRTTDEVAIDPALVWSDVREFRTAMREGRIQDALELYRGDLLSGFHLSDAPGFDDWLEGERSELRTLAANAAKQMAERLLADRQITGAVAHARKAVEFSGQDERMLRRLLVLLQSVGDRAAAVSTYESFAKRLNDELGSAPAPETQELISRIRSAASPAPGGATGSTHPDTDPFDQLAAALSDRYKVERELGAGGSATVYLATDLKLHRKVAVKVLRPSLAASVAKSRFFHEILIAAGLNHPHIVPLLDSGEAGGFVYYVMPWLTGESVRERLIREGRLGVTDAVQIAREVADALAYAHAHGVIHRDIKPENILLESGHAVVADFGIARAIGSAALSRPGAPQPASGTPAYVSPEQAIGAEPTDGRGDIYSLGCVLFEMLTGHPPFAGTTVGEVLEQHRSASPPDITTIRPEIPEDLRASIARSLAKDPGDRFALANELSEALAGVKAIPRRRHRWIAVAAFALLALGGGGAWYLYDPSPRVTILRRTAVTTTSARESYPSLSPDGETVVYSVDAYLMASVAKRSIASPEVEQTLLPAVRWGYSLPVHSPDGHQLLLSSLQGGIAIMSSDSGATPRVITTAGGSGAWSPDGERIVVTSDSTLMIYPTGAGERRLLTRASMLHSPAWSPDGAWIVYGVGNSSFHFNGNIAASELWLIGVDDGIPRRLVEGGFNTSPVWLPGGRSLLFISNINGGRDIYQLDLRADGTPRGAPVQLTVGLDPEHLSLSRDGTKLAYSVLSEASNIFALPATPRTPLPLSRARRITRGARIIENFSISSDARWLYFDSDQRGITHLFRRPFGGGPETQLTFGGSGDYAPRVSIDGTEIAFHAQRGPGPDRDVFVMPADGGTTPVRVSTSPEEELAAHLSPDRASLIWNQPFNEDSSLWISRRGPDGGWERPVPLLSGASLGTNAATWSPDGRWIAFHGAEGIQIFSPRTREVRTLLPYASGPAQGPVWDADSRSVVIDFTAPDGGFQIVRIPINGGRRTLIGYADENAVQEHRSGLLVFRDSVYFTLMERQADIWISDLRID